MPPDLFVDAGRLLRGVGIVGGRSDDEYEIGALFDVVLATKGITDERDIAEDRHLVSRLGFRFVDETAKYEAISRPESRQISDMRFVDDRVSVTCSGAHRNC